ncbi:MAG: type 1 glutamine amidotransferase [Gemmatimonadota bacterium]
MPNASELRFLLLQVRDDDDPMREHEIGCFERCFACDPAQIRIFDLLSGAPSQALIDDVDVVLLGGSGDYSVVRGGPWLAGALEAMRGLVDTAKPTFASCWGFQALARAMGGEVVTDRDRAEVGATWMALTDAGQSDPVFGPLGARFQAIAGHEDHVVSLPEGTVLLATSERSEHQAFRFEGKPIYATQFHPELDREGFLDRMRRYPSYVPLTGSASLDELASTMPDTDHTTAILERFLSVTFPAR